MDEADAWNSTASEEALRKTQKFIFDLILQESISNRTSIMLLIAFDAVAALMVIITIVYDAWKVSELSPLLKSEYVFLD